MLPWEPFGPKRVTSVPATTGSFRSVAWHSWSGDRAFPSRRPRVSGDTFMRLRLDEHAWPQWLTRIATHPVTAVAALVAVVLVALWALIALEARHVNGPRTPLVFSPK